MKIGLSACFFYPDPTRCVFGPKTLLYMEESMVKLVLANHAFPILLPRSDEKVSMQEILTHVDAVILQAGSDVAPSSYQTKALKEEWEGDAIRDKYEIGLLQEAIAINKPVLGICRGVQLINIALGGTLYQDILTQHDTKIAHRDAELYDKLEHEIHIEAGTQLAKLYEKIPERKVISVHHQAIKSLGDHLIVEGRSKEDGIIEAVRYKSSQNSRVESPYVVGIQWHPEYQNPNNVALMSIAPIIQEFLEEARKRKANS